MPYRSRRGAPIVSDKHEITWSNIGQNASTVQNINLGLAVQSADKNTSAEVNIGSHIRFIYIEFQFSAEAATTTTIVHWYLAQKRSGQTLTVPNLYYQKDRSQIVQRGMEMVPKDTSTVIKRIVAVRIPRIYQRMKDDSQWLFSYIASSTSTINACGFAIYKEIN